MKLIEELTDIGLASMATPEDEAFVRARYQAFAAAVRDAVMGQMHIQPSPCLWTEDDDGNWDSACGRYLSFENGTPLRHGYTFCHGCGKPITFTAYQTR